MAVVAPAILKQPLARLTRVAAEEGVETMVQALLVVLAS
jgi:hypothetical protein